MFRRKKVVHNEFENQPEGTDYMARIGDITIPKQFRHPYSKPKQEKMDKARNYYKKNGIVDKPISVEIITNELGNPTKFLLVDEYTRYLTLKGNDQFFVPVKYVSVLN